MSYLSRKKWMRMFPLFFIAIGVGFFVPISGSSLLGFIGKASLLIFIFFYLYMYSSKEDSGSDKNIEPWKKDTFEESMPIHGEEKVPWIGFGDAFRLYSQEFLNVVQNAVVASSTGLYLKKGQDALEFEGGVNKHGFVDRRFVIGENNLVTEVAKQKSSIIEENLPIGTVLEGVIGSEIRSFVGIPLILENDVVGVLAVGSENTENFSKEDENFLTLCGRLITQVMVLCHRGLRWEIDQEVYNVHLAMEKMLVNSNEEENTVYHFVQHIRRLFPFNRFTLCVREGDEGCIRYVYGQIDTMDRGMRFPLDDGLNGWLMKRNAPLYIKDMKEGDYIRPRYFKEEDSKHGLRSFLGIPLSHADTVWGCISIESRGVDQYGEKEKEVLMTLATPLLLALKAIQFGNTIKSKEKNGMPFTSETF